MKTNNMSSLSSLHGNKKFLLLFVLCCSLPLVTAKLALEFSWFNAGATNKGQWLEQEIQLLPASSSSRQHWHLVYVQAQQCDINCNLALYILQQIYTGLGRQQEQISILAIADQMPQALTRFPSITWQSPSISVSDFQDQIFIVNQQGLALLRYSVVNDPKKMLLIGKDIRTDLRRLMAYDRDGA